MLMKRLFVTVLLSVSPIIAQGEGGWPAHTDLGGAHLTGMNPHPWDGGDGGWINVPGGGGGGHHLTIPQADGSVLVASDDLQTFQVLELTRDGIIVRAQFRTGPVVLHTTWKDRTGLEHSVDTDCSGLTIAECIKKHNNYVQALIQLFPN